VLRQARYAIEAGVDILQVRERDLDGGTLATLVAAILVLVRGTQTQVVVNDRLDVALACGAAGVHLPAGSIPPARARAIVPPGFVIVPSVHSAREAVDVASAVDYVIAGTVWASDSKPEGGALLGPSGLASIVRSVDVPVLAIGGVTLDRIEVVGASGAAGVAAIGMFMGRPDTVGCRARALAETVQAARARFDTSRRAS